MFRSVAVEIDPTTWHTYPGMPARTRSPTWPPPPHGPAYPASFGPPNQDWHFDVRQMLLMIGFLTTPSHASGVSLSEFWAWIRYFHAISADDDVRLTPAFHELDPHQKTILSDDFGMGMPIYWLLDRLQLAQVVDGRYFIDSVATSVGAIAATKPKKRGPGKSPDFVAKDTSGVWHVIECKGTQTGEGYREAQLGSVGPPITGALAQKRTIGFPSGYSGQRLACGLYMGVEGGQSPSSLKIIDPPPDDVFEVAEDEIVFANDAVSRSITARSLRLAGFPFASSAVSAPFGARADSAPSSGDREQLRRETVDEKRARAAEELNDRTDRTLFVSEGERYRGRRVDISLPAPIWTGKKYSQEITLRYGVGIQVLEALRERPLVEEPLERASDFFREKQPRTRLDGDTGLASLHVGTTFVADVRFRG